MKFWFILILAFTSLLNAHAQTDSTQTWEVLNQQVVDLYQEGQYSTAIPIAQKALVQAEKEFGKGHPDYATSLNNLALLYASMGQYEQALPLYQQALKITEQALGKLHPSYATSLNNLALLYKSMGQYEQALPLSQQALTIREQALGKLHPSYANTLSNLAYLYQSMGQYEQALPLFQQALTIKEQVLSKLHPDYANTLNDLALSYVSIGQYEQALPLFQQALKIREQALGKLHPDYANTLNNLAKLYGRMDKKEQIPALFVELSQIYRKLLLQNLGILNEKTLKQYQQQFNQADFGYSMGLSLESPDLWGQNYNQSLLDKGAGLLAYQQLQRLLRENKDTLVTKLNTQYQVLQHTLSQLQNQGGSKQIITDLEQQVQDKQQALLLLLPAYRSAFNSLKTEWPQVQQHLKPDEAAIEFVDFSYWRKRWTDSTYYAALVLRPGWKSPRLVYLCEQRQLDSLVGKANQQERRTAYVERLYTAANRGVIVTPTGPRPHSLYGLVWQPIDSLLQGVRHVYYAASGLLHRLNLAAVPVTKSQRLSDRYQLTQLSSTRQLALPDSQSVAYSNHALLLGDIQYNLDSINYQTANKTYLSSRSLTEQVAVPGRNAGAEHWDALDNTGPEINGIADLLREAGYTPDTLTGWRASEDAFYYYTSTAQPSPRIIHIATHGYFQDSPQKSKPNDKGEQADKTPIYKLSDNPLIRSGLILSGGNNAWQGKKGLAKYEDGILTAYEISLLDLQKTELVALSACETGLGDIKGSEGVYGLQRAFKMAGVQNLIVSLWQVSDTSTEKFMDSFYGYHLRDKLPIRQAFDKAVLQMKGLYKEPYFWAGFVLIE